MSSDKALHRRMVREIGELFLTDPTDGELCLVSSEIKDNGFVVTNIVTGTRWRHTFQTEELRAREPGTALPYGPESASPGVQLEPAPDYPPTRPAPAPGDAEGER